MNKIHLRQEFSNAREISSKFQDEQNLLTARVLKAREISSKFQENINSFKARILKRQKTQPSLNFTQSHETKCQFLVVFLGLMLQLDKWT